jgi:hypothetical protein
VTGAPIDDDSTEKCGYCLQGSNRGGQPNALKLTGQRDEAIYRRDEMDPPLVAHDPVNLVENDG